MNVSLTKVAQDLRRQLRLYQIPADVLQRRTGLSRRTVGRLYSGKRDEDTTFQPSIETMIKVMRVVNQYASKN